MCWSLAGCEEVARECEIAMHRRSHRSVLLTGVLLFVACICALHAWVRPSIVVKGVTFTEGAVFNVRAVPFPPIY